MAVQSGDLVLAHHSVRNAGFVERVEAAAAARFAGIGLNIKEYWRLRQEGETDASLRAVLDANGVQLAEIEAVRGWDQPVGERDELAALSEDLTFAMADAFGCHHVQVVGSFEGTLPNGAADGFGSFCDRAAEHGLIVALEPLVCSTVTDVDVGESIVAAAGRPNGGLCIDIWHYVRGGWGEERLERVAPERVTLVQIDDGDAVPRLPDYLEDCLRYRLLPGDGDFDVVGFLSVLGRMGVQAPISVEVISDELDGLPAATAASRMADATRTMMTKADVTLAAPRSPR